MKQEQKQQITKMRRRGDTYNEIADFVEIPMSTVRSHCLRYKIYPEPPPDPKPNHCRYCGKHIQQKPKMKPRKFCCSKCRETYWNKNHVKTKGYLFKVKCAYCNKNFEKYKHSEQRFCCHRCYIFDRFGEVPQK